VPDGKDPYPLHPFKAAIPRGTATVDGALGEWPAGKPWVWMDSHGVALRGWARHDDRWLYLAFRLSGPWQRVSVVTDNNADGFYYGNDNVYIRVAADPSGPKLSSARAHLCSMNRWPYFDDKQERFRQADMRFAGGTQEGAQVFELALPRDPKMGLDLRKGEKLGLMVYVGLENGGTLALFEPWAIFDSVVQ
jgi:hypothetical protein